MRRILFFAVSYLFVINSFAQLKIDGAAFVIQPGAIVKVLGDVTCNVDIQGTGLLLLKGNALQNFDMGGFTIPNLEIDNAANATLFNTNARVGNSLLFTNGKILIGNLNLLLSATAAIAGANTSRFVCTNGTGLLKKELTSDIAAYELPVGENGNFRPAYLTTTGNTYSSANFGVRVLPVADPNKPPSTTSFLKTAWSVTKTGITGGIVTLEGQYIDPLDVTGTKANLVGYFNNGTDWSSVGETHNSSTNRISALITGNTGSLSAINKFLTVGARAFLQGAYDATTGLMNDNLRTLPFGSSSSIANFPSTDPYRVAPYNAVFIHVNNTDVETIASSTIVAAQAIAADNIVDWVFLELRNLNASPGNNVLQTRSALIQKDGDIVDMDGVSPVTFNNLADGNYIVAVRHRNHLGLSIDQSSPRLLNENKSTAFTTNVIDTRTATGTQLFGTSAAFATATHPVLGTVNLLWAGNANGNNQIRFSGLNNDRDFLLITTLNNNPASFINNVYHTADVNMNRAVRFSGLNNDRDYLLINILGNNPATFKSQALPD